MSFSLQEFIKASEDMEKKRESAREAQRANDLQIRTKEREDDLQKIAGMI